MLNEKSLTGHAVVVGAGVMGAGIAAHLANIGWTVDLLDQDAALAKAGLDRALKARPPAFALPAYAARVQPGSAETDLARATKADWVVEAIAEDPALKANLMQRLAAVVGPETVISSNTSGLGLAAMVAGCPMEFQRRFLGTHFFNPPRQMRCLELAPAANTDPAIFEGFCRFADRVLGKRVIRAKDTPGFISTRLGMYNLAKTIELAVHHGMTVEQVDYLTGPLIGRPKSGTFRLADVIGLDITARIIDNLKAALPDDEAYQRLEIPPIMRRLIAEGRTGAKAGAGFYKRDPNGEILSLDLTTGDYRPRQEHVPVPAEIEALPLKERFPRLVSNETWEDPCFHGIDRLVIDGHWYMLDKGHRVADSVVEVDDALMLGFGWEMGPYQLEDALGEAWEWHPENGPDERTIKQCYRNEAGQHFYYDFRTQKLEPLPRPAEYVVLKDLKKAGKTVEEAGAASLIDLGDGVACFEWRTKMNVLDPALIAFLGDCRGRAERDFAALVLGGSGEHFSAGFDLKQFTAMVASKELETLDRILADFQNCCLGLKYARIPLVAAVYGYTLGGGCELMLHCAAVQASFESSIGLPEANVGLIPAGGGTTELCLRALDDLPPGTILERSDPYPFLRPLWETLRLGKFSASAPETRALGFLRDTDGITVNPDRLLHDAKERALAMSVTYAPPTPPLLGAGGPPADLLARFQWELHLLRSAGQITAHDARIADRLAYILCGGDAPYPVEVTEQRLLDLEREAFLSLAGTPETLARIQHTLATGKPLKN